MTPEIDNIIKLGIERLNRQGRRAEAEIKEIRLRLTLAIIEDILKR